MKELAKKKLNEIRKLGLRPSVVCCFIRDKNIFLFYKKDYKLWLLPQSGIKNDQEIEGAVTVAIKEELAETFLELCDKDFMYIGEGEVIFGENSRGIKELKTDEGDEVKMKGKKYFFFTINVKEGDVKIEGSRFDECFLLDYKTAKGLLSLGYQTKKRDLVLNALAQLQKTGVIE